MLLKHYKINDHAFLELEKRGERDFTILETYKKKRVVMLNGFDNQKEAEEAFDELKVIRQKYFDENTLIG